MKAATAPHDLAMVREAAHDLADLDDLVAMASTAEFVLIGEASHGTQEFYEVRAELTKRLISGHGFDILALEADWPDMLRVHRYVAGQSLDRVAASALGDFKRFPAWMWRNTVVVEFVEWLRGYNQDRSKGQRGVGIFGMDLYSMHASMDAVLAYLDKSDPPAAQRARERYACFDAFGEDPQRYGYAATRGRTESCEDEVVEQLLDLRRQYRSVHQRDGQSAEDEVFFAEQNARVVAGAEQYYRAMFRGRDESWNLRDEHMADTLEALVSHFSRGRPPKVIVWAHNSHLGDARATEMGRHGEWNVGQLARQRFGNVFSVGFSTWSGSVTAAFDWGSTAQRKRVRPALAGSYEDLFHAAQLTEHWLPLKGRGPVIDLLRKPRLQRAIGVIYRPETERASHYFEACLPDQFDALIHLDETKALEPLERTGVWEDGQLPETYPYGM